MPRLRTPRPVTGRSRGSALRGRRRQHSARRVRPRVTDAEHPARHADSLQAAVRKAERRPSGDQSGTLRPQCPAAAAASTRGGRTAATDHRQSTPNASCRPSGDAPRSRTSSAGRLDRSVFRRTRAGAVNDGRRASRRRYGNRDGRDRPRHPLTIVAGCNGVDRNPGSKMIAPVLPPLVDFASIRVDGVASIVQMTMDRQTFALFPAPDSRDVAAQIRADLLPRVETAVA